MHAIDFALLRKLVPYYHARPGNNRGERQKLNLTYLSFALDPTLNRWGINTPLRKAHFLGQTSVESRDFTTTYEDNTDGTPVDGKRYEGKKNLGNTQPGDGARFIGRGLIQLTGRDNYQRSTFELAARGKVSKDDGQGPMCLLPVDLVKDPFQAAQYPTAIDTACEYWMRRHINHYADKDDAIGVTRSINTAMLDLLKRKQRTEAAKRLLAVPSDTEIGDALTRNRMPPPGR